LNTNREVRTQKREHVYSTLLFDIDGTLVDSNEAHAQAWVKAFAESAITVDAGKVRRAIGMGGDKLMPAIGGIEEDSPRGRTIAKRRGEIFLTELLPQLRPFADADRLVLALKERGFTMVAASSAKREELTRLLKIAGVERVLDASTSSDDADNSKPDPDILHAALQRAKSSPDQAVMIGDTPYDIAAATRAGVAAIAFRCGGWQDTDLAGAIAIYDGPWHLLRELDSSPLSEHADRRG
jgi:HAD superfamily hydrolase (TIGR01509 family)